MAEESAQRVVIALSCLDPVGFKTAIGGFRPHHADLELRDPVGSRAVIDASAGVARPSLAQLRTRLRRGGRRDRSDAPGVDVTDRVAVPREAASSDDPPWAEIRFFPSSEDVAPNREHPEGG